MVRADGRPRHQAHAVVQVAFWGRNPTVTLGPLTAPPSCRAGWPQANAPKTLARSPKITTKPAILAVRATT